MPDACLDNRLRRLRKGRGLTQQELAELAGVSRQTVASVEAGRSAPSTSLGLQLAHVLGCAVEDVFQLAAPAGMGVRLAPEPREDGRVAGRRSSARVAVGRVAGRWVAHRLPFTGATAADGIVASSATESPSSADRLDPRRPSRPLVQPLTSPRKIERNVLVAGCAPLLGLVAQWTGRRFADARVRWLRAGNRRALELLAAGLVHVAGLHVRGGGGEAANLRAVRRALPRRRLLVVNLTRWRQGIVVPPGNPLAIAGAGDLFRPGLRLARRERGSGAHALTRQLRADAGACGPGMVGPWAEGHEEVAWLVRRGSADAGVAIEGAALAEGLDFVPVAEERFDLVVPAELASRPPASRLVEALDDPGLRAEAAVLPGYDLSLTGHVATVEAA